jgi:hypothetical protein
MVVPGENPKIVMDGRFILFLDYLIPNLVSKVPNYFMRSNFLINKVKNRRIYLFISCLPSTSMGVSSSKGMGTPSLANTINKNYCVLNLLWKCQFSIHVYI